jgi:Ran GTPase-activating protein (RanGAP) involved in mRNA processing and transport
MGALSVLSLESNRIHAEGGKALAEGLEGNQVITELNISDNRLGKSGRSGRIDISGIIALADVIPDMGALTSLNLSSNLLKAEGAKIVAEAIEVTNNNNVIAVILAPFLCPSDHWLNVCCLLLSTG